MGLVAEEEGADGEEEGEGGNTIPIPMGCDGALGLC